MGEFNNNNNNNENENEVYFEVEDTSTNMEKKKKTPKRGVAGTLAIALACSVIGGGAGGLGVYSAMKDSKVDEDTKIEKTYNENDSEAPSFKNSGTMTTDQVVEKVMPFVVGVSTKSIVKDNYFNALREQEGIGSGFIINKDGLVVTNYHVIKGANEVKVILSDGTEVNAKVVNYDANADIAVLDITENIEMPGIATLGDSSKLKAGEDVIAIGNPLGKEFSKTVTKGVVSSPNRVLSTDSTNPENTQEFIQTDAAINPGNSGGPLINANGEVIGINTAKKVGEEIEGIGFSIPINLVKEKLDSLSKPILNLGIMITNVTPEIAARENLPEGVYIRGINEFSPAEKAGLKIGDVITEYNGTTVKSAEELNKLKEGASENEVVNLTVVRDGKKIVVPVKLTA